MLRFSSLNRRAVALSTLSVPILFLTCQLHPSCIPTSSIVDTLSQTSSAPRRTSLPTPPTPSFPSMRLLPPPFSNFTPSSSPPIPPKPHTHKPKRPIQPRPLLSKNPYPYTIHAYPLTDSQKHEPRKKGGSLAGFVRGKEGRKSREGARMTGGSECGGDSGSLKRTSGRECGFKNRG